MNDGHKLEHYVTFLIYIVTQALLEKYRVHFELRDSIFYSKIIYKCYIKIT